jgi:carbamoyltransferase
MAILGMGGSGHDWACCLIRDGKITSAIAEERLTRKKYGLGADLLTSLSRQACLRSAGCSAAEVSHAVACDLVPLTLAAPFRHRLIRIRHHLAHAYAAFFASGFDSAAVLVVDAAGSPRGGDWFGSQRPVETMTFWVAQDTEVRILDELLGTHLLQVRRPAEYYQVGETDNSLGHFYRIISEELGFVFRSAAGHLVTEDGKTMGLAAYGDDRYVQYLNEFLSLEEGGKFRLPLVDGVVRSHIHKLLEGGEESPDNRFAKRAAMARAAQAVVEQAMLHAAKHLQRSTRKDKLVLAGGVALNCLANARIAREAGFEDVFVFPAAGDDGIAVGCALYGLLELEGYRGPLNINEQLPFLGPVYEADLVAEAIEQACHGGIAPRAAGETAAVVAQELAAGKIVAWYEGRSEFGPRALGHRSIFADPRPRMMRERLNEVTKRREAFRPFAPIVEASRAAEFFELPSAARSTAPFMLTVAKVKQEWRDRLAAVTHIDGTARLQTVSPSRYPSLCALLIEFEKITQLPILLNTSFNQGGEPLVETPSDAVSCFLQTDIDLLVLDKRILDRPSPIGELQRDVVRQHTEV